MIFLICDIKISDSKISNYFIYKNYPSNLFCWSEFFFVLPCVFLYVQKKLLNAIPSISIKPRNIPTGQQNQQKQMRTKKMTKWNNWIYLLLYCYKTHVRGIISLIKNNLLITYTRELIIKKKNKIYKLTPQIWRILSMKIFLLIDKLLRILLIDVQTSSHVKILCRNIQNSDPTAW